jgi:hypothetical protein
MLGYILSRVALWHKVMTMHTGKVPSSDDYNYFCNGHCIVSAHILERNNVTIYFLTLPYLFLILIFLFILFFIILLITLASPEMFISFSSQLVFLFSFTKLSISVFHVIFTLPFFGYPQRKTCQVLLVEAQNMEQKRSLERVLSKLTVFRGGTSMWDTFLC